MNMISFYAGELSSEGRIFLSAGDRRSEHLRKILRVKERQCLKAGVLKHFWKNRYQWENPLSEDRAAKVRAVEEYSEWSGLKGFLVIDEINSDGSYRAHFEPSAEPSPPVLPIHLIIGMVRPPVIKRLLRDLSSVGVRRITLVQSGLCEGIYTKSRLWDNIEEYLILGAEQGGFTELPEVQYQGKLAEFLSLGGRGEKEYAFVFDSGAGKHPSQYLNGRNLVRGSWTFAIGPERGWTRAEVELFQNYGFDLLKIGNSIFRSEMTAYFAVSLYFYYTGSKTWS